MNMVPVNHKKNLLDQLHYCYQIYLRRSVQGLVRLSGSFHTKQYEGQSREKWKFLYTLFALRETLFLIHRSPFAL